MSTVAVRFTLGVALSWAFVVPLSAETPATVDPAFPNYRLVRPGLAVAGQPTSEGLARLKEMGFKTVVNLRTEKEGAKDEEAAVKAAGLRYVWVPVTAESLSQADADAVGKVLDDPTAGPVLLHCSTANRVGALWALLRMRQGATLEEAENDAKALGLRSPALIEAVRKLGGAKP